MSKEVMKIQYEAGHEVKLSELSETDVRLLRRVIEICAEEGIPVEIRPFTLEEMCAADEIFTTSSTSLCSRVGKVDHTDRGMKDPATFRRLQDAIYRSLTSKESPMKT